MQLVAASKMKKAQNSALSGKDYAESLIDMTHLLSSYIDKDMNPLVGEAVNASAPMLNILIAPQKGLCGGLVTNLTRYISMNLDNKNQKNDFIVVGNKARTIARRLKLNVIAEFDMELSYPKYEFALPIARIIEERFRLGKSSGVNVFFADFVNTMTQNPQKRILLPLDLNVSHGKMSDRNIDSEIKKDYIFEPSPESIVNPLLEMYLEIELYQILLEAYASEQSARMVAMKNATDNATNLISELTVDFNKARQAGITNEILDIGNHMFSEN